MQVVISGSKNAVIWTMDRAKESGAKIVILNREETIYDAMANIVINDELKIICKELIKLI